MAAEVAPTMQEVEGSRAHFWRRLHSLTGILPIGAFLLFHAFENLKAVRGAEAYNEGVLSIANMVPGPYLLAIELAVLALPILFHGFYGAFLIYSGKSNTGLYPYRQNRYYLWQRISGVVALAFIVFHVLELRIKVTLMGTGSGLPGHPGYVNYHDVASHLSNNWIAAFYALGVIASAFHLGNGLNGFCWTWGLAVNERSRKAVEVIGWVLTIAVSVVFLNVLWAFRQ